MYTPYGIRTRVYAVKEHRPGPLDERGAWVGYYKKIKTQLRLYKE